MAAGYLPPIEVRPYALFRLRVGAGGVGPSRSPRQLLIFAAMNPTIAMMITMNSAPTHTPALKMSPIASHPASVIDAITSSTSISTRTSPCETIRLLPQRDCASCLPDVRLAPADSGAPEGPPYELA